MFTGYPDYFKDLRDSFLGNDFVKKHFSNPEQSWDDVATVNNDGSRAIIEKLNAIAEVLDDARRATYLSKLESIREGILDSLNVYYEPEDIQKKNEQIKTIAGDIKLSTDLSFGKDPELLGRIIDGMMVSPSSLREIAYDILNRYKYLPKTSSAIKTIRAMCNIGANDTRDVKIHKLLDRYKKVDEAGLKTAWEELGLKLDEIISDNELLETVPDVVAKHIVEFWNDNIDKNVKVQLNKYLPHGDWIAFMFKSLLERLEVKKRISEKIKCYVDSNFAPRSLPSVIADYAALTLNNFVSFVGRTYMKDADLDLVKKKSEVCDLDVEINPIEATPSAKPQPLTDVLLTLDKSIDLMNSKSINTVSLRKLPFMDNYIRWLNFITIGLLYTCDVSSVDPEANAQIKSIIDSCSTLYRNKLI